MNKRVKTWSTYRKLMSNLVPALVCVPVFATGLVLFQRDQRAASVVAFGASVVVGIFAVNLLGLFHNRKMQSELRRLVLGRSEPYWFVGIAKQGSVSALDPHDDLGFLLISAHGIEYIGETAHYKIPYSHIVNVGYRMNAHSLLGLGRWISINGRHDGKPFQLLFEPRSYPTILQNRKQGAEIVAQLKSFLAQPKSS